MLCFCRHETISANSQLSTGRRAGQSPASMNAVKTGLTGSAGLLPNDDDAARYERHVTRYISDFEPVGDRESELVRGLADTNGVSIAYPRSI
jgi:hypothetical protein